MSTYMVRYVTLQVVIGIVCLLLGWRLFFYSRHPFWDIQPVFHYRNFLYWFYDHGILRKELPPRNRFVNPLSIQTYTYLPSTLLSTSVTAASSPSPLPPTLKNECTALLTSEYHRDENSQYAPTSRDIWCYFDGHSAPSFISVYTTLEPILNRETHDIHSVTTVKGVITSRPMHVAIRTSSSASASAYSQMNVYYVDFLCVAKQMRRKNIAPQLIQTHEYNQSHAYLPISVSVFKREEELTSIVPIVLYSVVGYSIAQWKHTCAIRAGGTMYADATSTTHPVSNGRCHVVAVSRSHFAIYLSALTAHSNHPSIRFFMSAHTANHLECIESNQWHVFMLVDHEQELNANSVHPHGVVALYYFRNTCIQWNGQPVVSLFASIQRTDTATFQEGAIACLSILDHLSLSSCSASSASSASSNKWNASASTATSFAPPTSIKNIQNQNHDATTATATSTVLPVPRYSLLCIECLGNNSAFILSSPFRPLYQSKMAYYFYNFAHRTFSPSQCLILC